MTSNAPSITSDQPAKNTGPEYTPHPTEQLGQSSFGASLPQAGFQSIGDHASSGNYAGGTGNSDEPIDRAATQATFNASPYMRGWGNRDSSINPRSNTNG